MSNSTFTPPPLQSLTPNNPTYPKLSCVTRSKSFVPPPPPTEFEEEENEKRRHSQNAIFPLSQPGLEDELPLEKKEEEEEDEEEEEEKGSETQILSSEGQGHEADTDKPEKRKKKKTIDEIVKGIPQYVKDKKELKPIIQPKNTIKMRFQSYDNGQMETDAYEFFDENSPEKRYPIFLDEKSKDRFKTEISEKKNIEGIIVDWKDAKVSCPLNRYCIKKGRMMYFISLKPVK